MEQGWKTGISVANEEKTLIRGYELEELMTKLNFTQAIWLLWKGELPSDKEESMFNTILISAIEHGIAPPSVTAARTAYSGSGQFNSSVAAGILSIGKHHGGAIEQCAQLLQTSIADNSADNIAEMKRKSAESATEIAKQIVDNMVEKKQRIPGFGHKLYTDADPRAQKILDAAKKHGYSGIYIETLFAIEKCLEQKKGKKLCINIDGAIASVLLEMGFDWKLGMGFFIMARTAGIIAHVYEEAEKEKPFRRLADEEISYDGQKQRKI